MIEHSESAFYSQIYEWYHKQIVTGQDKGNSQEETETFFDEQKVCMHNKENSQWHSVNELVNTKISVKKRADREREREWREESALTK